ncbi:MAG: hypothetical protein IPN60_05790 [Saprospiraceae bacterium]|nr:hypothetical protein [Candidatus Opimibacter skivensis]
MKETVQVDGYLDGHLESVYFYGAEQIPSNPESLKRKFNRYDLFLKIGQAYAPETSLSYSAFMQYMTDKDDLGSRETTFKVGGEVKSAFGGGEYPLGIKILADLSKLTHTEQHTVNNLLINPFFDYAVGDLSMHFGATALLRKKQNEILPDLEFSFPLIKTRLTVFAGWVGRCKRITFISYLPITLISAPDSIVSIIWFQRNPCGCKGASGSLFYELKGSYTSFEGMAFFPAG